MMSDTGERGEKGDQGQHGQDGTVGETGPQGKPGKGAPHRALIGYLILFAFFLAGSYGLWHTDQKAERAIQVNCDFGNENRRVIRLILQDANKRTQTSQQRSEEEKRVANKIYTSYLKELEPFDCDALK